MPASSRLLFCWARSHGGYYGDIGGKMTGDDGVGDHSHLSSQSLLPLNRALLLEIPVEALEIFTA